MALMVGQLYLKSKNPKEVSCSSIERLSSVNISSATALGRNSFLISDTSKSCKEVQRHGLASKVRTFESLLSVNIFSSASEAMLFRGPTRTQIRPL